MRVVPGVFTTTRFGIQGGIDVRNVPADTYFRGMKRLNLQGHGRSVLAAMDTIEVVKGRPRRSTAWARSAATPTWCRSPAARPKAAISIGRRASRSGISGSYDRAESSFGVGGPLSFERAARRLLRLRPRRRIRHVRRASRRRASGSCKRRRASTTCSAPSASRPASTTRSRRPSGALIGRFTRSSSTSGRYMRGSPLVDLDANGNGHDRLSRDEPRLAGARQL